MTAPNPHDSNPEYSLIVASLNRIRRRLWLTRLAERLALALASGAVVAVFLISARLLRERVPAGSSAVAVLPILIAAWLWFRTPRIDNAVLNPVLIRMGAVIAALLSLATVAVFSLPVWHSLPLWSFSVASLAAFALAAAASVRLVDTRTAAIFVDQQVGLKERVSTALEFLATDPTSALEASFRRPLVDSALVACTTVRTAPVGYARLDRRVYALAVTTLLAAGGLTLLNPLPAIASRNPQQIIIVQSATDLLAKKIKEIEEKKTTAEADANQKLEPLKLAIQDIKRGNMNPFEAAARLAEARGDLQKTSDALAAADKVQQALEAARNLDQLSQASEQMKQADLKSAGGEAGASQAKSEAQRNLDSSAESLGDKLNSGKMSAAEQKGLASDLKAAADKAKDDPQLQKSLEQAADAAKKGDGDSLSKNLSEAGARIGQQSAERKLSGQSLRDAMSACDGASNGLGGDEQSAKGGQQGSSQDNGGGDNGGQDGGQPGDSGGSQANSGGNQNPGQDGGGQPGGQQSAGGGANGQGGGKDGSNSQQVSAGGDSRVGGGGSTNFHGPSGPGDVHQGTEIHGTGTFVKLYAEKLVGTNGKQIKVSGAINPLGPSAGRMEVLGPADKTDKTIVEYDAARGAARARAMDDLSKDQIPPQYRDLIRNYYGK